jgi:hypothetical protein
MPFHVTSALLSMPRLREASFAPSLTSVPPSFFCDYETRQHQCGPLEHACGGRVACHLGKGGSGWERIG